MDFVVGGVWLGALAVLVGLALRDGGARWTRFPGSSRAISREYAAALDAVCRAGGRLLLLGGGALLLVTALALLAGASDAVGATVVVLTTAFVAVAVAWWAIHANRVHLRPLAAWPAPIGASPGDDGPPPLAVAIDRGLAASGVANEPSSASPERDDAPVRTTDEPGRRPGVVLAEADHAEFDEPKPEAADPVMAPESVAAGEDRDTVVVEMSSPQDRDEVEVARAEAAPDPVPRLDDATAAADPIVDDPLDLDAEPAGDAEIEFAGRGPGERRFG